MVKFHSNLRNYNLYPFVRILLKLLDLTLIRNKSLSSLLEERVSKFLLIKKC